MTLDLFSIFFLMAFVGALLLFILLPRYGPHYTSRLTCPNCKRIFNFHWIPGATITSLVYRNKRTLKCPYCHVKSNYDVMSTRVTKSKKTSKVKQRA
jgi:phage FluMu protein Com